VCDCLDSATVSAPSNVYFVVDRSGSVGLEGAWSGVLDLVQLVATQLGPKAAFGAAAFPDPGSRDACAIGREVFPTARGDGPPGTMGATTTGLLAALGGAPGGGAPLAATLDAIAPTLQGLGPRTSVVLVTDGAPSCNGHLTCDAQGCIANIENAAQCPAGGPPSCCDPALAGPLECLDDAATLAAIGRVATVGAPVYVVSTASPTSPFAPLLARMARAGGGPSASALQLDPSDGAALASSLAATAAHVLSSCAFPLKSAPSSAKLVSVELDGTLVPPGPDGWSLSGAEVTLEGASCRAVTSASVGHVRIAVACPGSTQ
jgi:hypothetical protein